MPDKGHAASAEAGKIARALGVISSTTMLSRVMGLLRDSLTAALFGAGGFMDAFLVAFKLPNMLRGLLAEGSLTVSFIPVYTEVMEKEGDEAAHKLGRVVITALTLILAVIVLLGILAAPWIVNVVAMGFKDNPEKFNLTVSMTRWLFPFIAFVSLTAIAGGILNAREQFFYPALAPVVLNLCNIVVTWTLYRYFDLPIMAMVLGVLVGGVAQLLIQVRPLGKLGFHYFPDFAFRSEPLKKILLLMGPSTFGVAVYQFNIVISTFFASWLPEGAVSYLYYSERLFQLPLGVFAVSIGVASLPSLSRLAAREDWISFNHTVSHAIRLLFFIVLPASIGLMILSEPIVALLFERGRFTPEMTIGTSTTLKFYALAMIPVSITRVFAQSFYAVKEMKTPVKGAFVSLVVNVFASWLFAFPLGLAQGGLALATAFSSTVNMFYLSEMYRRKNGENPFKGLYKPLFLIALASLGMGALVWLGDAGFIALAGKVSGFSMRLLEILLVIPAGVAGYIVFAKLLGLKDLSELTGRLRGN